MLLDPEARLGDNAMGAPTDGHLREPVLFALTLLRSLGASVSDNSALVNIISAHGQIPAVVRSDPSMRAGVISMTHGWGGLPGEATDYRQVGSNPNLLIDARQRDPINAMPVMSAIPVRIERAAVAAVGTAQEWLMTTLPK